MLLWTCSCLRSLSPYKSSEDRDRRDDDRTERADRTKYSDDDFLGDDIAIERHASNRHDSNNLRKEDFPREVSYESEDREDRIDDERDHRKSDFEYLGSAGTWDRTIHKFCIFSISEWNLENNRSWIFEYSTTRELI